MRDNRTCACVRAYVRTIKPSYFKRFTVRSHCESYLKRPKLNSYISPHEQRTLENKHTINANEIVCSFASGHKATKNEI